MNHKHVSAALALTGAGIIVLAQQLVDGKITSLAQFSQRVNEEIAFQKIAIREETEA